MRGWSGDVGAGPPLPLPTPPLPLPAVDVSPAHPPCSQLKDLLQDEARTDALIRDSGGVYMDFSRQNATPDTVKVGTVFRRGGKRFSGIGFIPRPPGVAAERMTSPAAANRLASQKALS